MASIPRQLPLWVFEKRCPRCGDTKPVSEFGRHAKRADGLRATCKLCTTAENRARWAADPQRFRDYYQARYYRDRERILATAREAWRTADRDDYNRKKREYCKQNRDVRRRIEMRRRGLERGAGGTFSQEQLDGRWDYYGGRCWMCGDVATVTDHVIPLARGGTNWPANLRPACRPCNARKYCNDWRPYVEKSVGVRDASLPDY